MVLGRSGFVTATQLNAGKVVVAGNVSQVELYDPQTNSFTLGPTSNLPVGWDGSATLLK